MLYLKLYMRRFNEFLQGEYHLYEPKDDPIEALSALHRIIINGYQKYCRKKNNSDWTISSKRAAAIFFLRLIEESGIFDMSFDARDTTAALLHVKNNDQWNSIRLFLIYLHDAGSVSEDYANLIPYAKNKVPYPTVYTIEEIKKIEAVIDRNTLIGKRDYAMILLDTRLGMRAGDIVNLKIADFDFEHNKICLNLNKGGNLQEFVLLPVIKNAVNDYLEASGNSGAEYIFESADSPKRKVTTGILRHRLNYYFAKAGIDIKNKKHGPHSIRSSMTSSMVNDGASYETVRKILGHEDRDAVKHYAALDIETLRKCAIEVKDPSGSFLEFLGGDDKNENMQ